MDENLQARGRRGVVVLAIVLLLAGLVSLMKSFEDGEGGGSLVAAAVFMGSAAISLAIVSRS